MNILTGAKEYLDKKTAEQIAKLINKYSEKQTFVTLALPGGRSVSGIFSNLLEQNISWNKVHIFLIDERLVPLNSEESNFRLIKDTLATPLVTSGKLPPENIHPFKYDKNLSDSGLASYEQELLTISNYFDIILVSSGEDGHIAGLFPNHETILNTHQFFITTNSSPKPPEKRMTASRSLIERSKSAVILFIGDAKRQALSNFDNPALTIEQCPAKLVKKVHDNYIITDLI
ncbi:MAG: 6-phosphogluconolactonase [Nanoarchaeota archaeon]